MAFTEEITEDEITLVSIHVLLKNLLGSTVVFTTLKRIFSAGCTKYKHIH